MDWDSETDSDTLVDSDTETETDSLKDVEASSDSDVLTDWVSDTDSEADSLSEIDASSDSDALIDWESDTEIVTRTTLSASARASLPSSDVVAVLASASSACAAVVTTAPPRIAPVAKIPFNKVRLGVAVVSSETSATTSSSTWPRTTLKRPKLEVAARSQFFPDLINLNRVTRSVSRNDPLERLKNICSPYYSV